jgi:hypothetical protein
MSLISPAVITETKFIATITTKILKRTVFVSQILQDQTTAHEAIHFKYNKNFALRG